ncbi:hypothetical protein OG871_27565 [Kitasatospora sp. NBC_00374]|uniref:DUF7210 family protein n=1 Tax=Kitasatospora sp. NBC_00374 TaxID=2975964 RepID=UPI0030E4FAD8
MASNVRITLAHHLTRDGADLAPGDEIEVPHHEARQLIASGYVAGADPSDPEAVAKALAPEPSRKQLAAKPPADKAEAKPSA